MKQLKGFWALAFILLSTAALGENSNVSIGARFDCLHLFNADKGSNQNCLTLSSLKLRLDERTGPTTSAFIELDPFAGPDFRRNRHPGSVFYPERSKESLINDFAFLWTPRPSLLVKVGAHHGLIASQLFSSSSSFEGGLLSGPWKQLALTVAYKLALFETFDVEMTVGNGEGELFENLDPQQYFSFLAKAEVSKGIWAGLGVSLDGNSAGSSQSVWLQEYLADNCGGSSKNDPTIKGFQTQRALVFLALDGKRPGWEGFKSVFSHRRMIKRDLDTSIGTTSIACKQEDWSWLQPESVVDGSHNTLEIQENVVGLGYRILDTAEIGVNFSALKAKATEAGFFNTCAEIIDGSCVGVVGAVDSADQTSYSVSFALDLNEKLRLNAEYHARAYDRIYKQLYYQGRNNAGGKEADLFNAGILYNFDR